MAGGTLKKIAKGHRKVEFAQNISVVIRRGAEMAREKLH